MALLIYTLLLLSFTLMIYCEQYTSKYDNIDIDEILQSERLLKNYFNCLMDKGPCTPDGAELRRVLPDALQTACEKCSENQKNGIKKIVKRLIDKHQDLWQQLRMKFDPDNTYYNKYKEELDKINV